MLAHRLAMLRAVPARRLRALIARPLHTSCAVRGSRGANRTSVINVKTRLIPSSYNPDRGTKEQDKLLFTPGPLTTSYSVKKAMMRDLGSRDQAFIGVIREVQAGLLEVARVKKEDFAVIPMQGSGTFGVEAILSSVVNKKTGALLIIANGSYGMRMRDMARVHGIPHTCLECPEDAAPDLAAIENELKGGKLPYTHVAVVHSETTSGIINDVETIGDLVHKYKKSFIVDAMSSFGGVTVDFARGHIDYLISSSNKCIEGVPGFSFIIARRSALEASKGNASTLSLDIHKQHAGIEGNGQFRFTPPCHSLMAFAQALAELHLEGGVEERARRYQQNQRVLYETMTALGFEPYLKTNQGYIITSYRYPKDPHWNFGAFYEELNKFGCVIYPGKVSNADCFRIGHIGRIFPRDTKRLCSAIERVCKKMRTAKFYKDPALEKPKRPTRATTHVKEAPAPSNAGVSTAA